MKAGLRAMFDQVLASLDVRTAMEQVVAAKLRGHAERPALVLAFGKAARLMAEALIELLPERTLRGLVVPPEPDVAPLPPFEVIAGGHPLPSSGSLRAADRALLLARCATADEDVVFLVSGGGSAMFELPAVPNVSVAELRDLNQALLASGANIDEINTIRRHLSAVKGGRLALAAIGARHLYTLAVSDVPLTSPATALASGPTVGDPTTVADCRDVLRRYQLERSLPRALRARLAAGDLPPPLSPEHELTTRSDFDILLDERRARTVAATWAKAAGYVVDATIDVDNWTYQDAAEHLLARLEALHVQHPGKRVAIVTTGELTVRLPSQPGTGGRNSQFALQCATRIENRSIAVLSCGTDGIDGNSPAAGAIVDGTTVARAAALGMHADDHLLRCDAHPLLDALQDCVTPGPTGSNVRDLRLLVHEA